MKFFNKHKTLLVIMLILLVVVSSVVIIEVIEHYEKKKVINELSKLDLNQYNKVMIVAHPDDEMLWGGGALIDDNYLVVCITCGSNRIRVKEFKSVMDRTNDQYLMLNYPDKILFKRSNWKFEHNYIENDIKKILNYKKWDEIATHNKYGEYGHKHHIMIHDMVMKVSGKEGNKKISVFNKYCSLNKLNSGRCNLVGNISDENIQEKSNILYTYYKSQTNTINLFKHMLAYENINKE